MGARALALLAGTLAALALPGHAALAAVVPAGWADAARWAGSALWLAIAWPRPTTGTGRGARAGSGVRDAAGPAVAALAGAGIAMATLVGEHARRHPFELPGAQRVLTGRIVDVPVVRDDYTSFTLGVETIAPVAADEAGLDAAAATAATRAPRGARVRIALRAGAHPVRAGERWRLVVRLGALDGLANDGGFDRERWMLGARLHGRGSVRRAPERPADAASGGGFRSSGALSAWRQRARERLAGLTGAGEHLPVVEALSLGIGDAVSEDVRALLRATGTAHLLAISGLHVGLVAAGVAALVGALWRGLRGLSRGSPEESGRRRGPIRTRLTALGTDIAVPATLLAAAAAAGYTLMAGGSLPTRRALAMLAVVGAAGLAHRRIGRADGLAAALVAVLLLDPLAPVSPGLWLSFGAVATVLWLHASRRLPRAAWLAAVRTHALLGVALLPAGAWFFQEASLSAPLANLVAVPLATLVVVPASLAAALLSGAAPVIAGIALRFAETATGWLLWLLGGIDALAGGDGTPMAASLPGPLALAGIVGATVVLTWPAARRLFGFVPLLVLPALLHWTQGRAVAALEVHVLDVGQGLAVLLLTPEATVLYDTGGRRGDTTMLEAVVLPHLRAQGRDRLDALVISHPDSDHAAGLVDARRRFPDLPVLAGNAPAAEAVLAGERGDPGDPGAPVRACVAGTGFALDGVRFDALHPAAHDVHSDNDGSCVLLVHVGAARVLLPGDVEAGAEARLVERLGAVPLEVDVLVSPHHGSRTSSTGAFVATFPARHVVHAAGLANAYGFPHDPVTMRYTTGGARQHVTGLGGALVFRFDADGLMGPPEPRRRASRLAWLGASRGPDDR